MLVNISFAPVGAGADTNTVLANALRLVEESKINCQITATGILMEGDWDELFDLIKGCQNEIKKYCERVVTNISIDDFSGHDNRISDDVVKLQNLTAGLG